MYHSVHRVEDVDVPRIAEVLYHSQIPDGIQQYIATIWPGLDTVEGRSEACTRLLRINAHLPDTSYFLKVVDERNGSLVAFAICFHSSEPPRSAPGLTETIWATEEDREYARDLKAERDALLLRTMSPFQEPVTEIMAFFVDASQQHQGIGTLLMQHIISLNKRRRVPLVLLSNPTAVQFYKKQGFQAVEDRQLSVPDIWHARPSASLVSMIFKH